MKKLLGITVVHKLLFEPHSSKIFKKIIQIFHGLARVLTHISQKKLRMIMRAFTSSQFSYFPLVWMCHSRTVNNKIVKRL